MVGDAPVITDTVAGTARQITAEGAKAGVELLEDNGLSLNLADLLGDNPLSHLLYDKKALLDNLNRLAVADNFLLFFYDGLAGDRTAEVIGAIEVVEAGKGRDATPVVEGEVCSSN